MRYSSSRMSQDPGSLETACREVHPKSMVSHISSVTCVILHQECPCLCFHPCIVEHPPQLSRVPKCIQTSQKPKGGCGSLIPTLITDPSCLFILWFALTVNAHVYMEGKVKNLGMPEIHHFVNDFRNRIAGNFRMVQIFAFFPACW